MNDNGNEYERGYAEATVDITKALEAIIERNEDSDMIAVEVMALVLGNKVILAGGSAEEASFVRDLLISL